MKNEKLSKVNPVMIGMTLSLLVLLLVTNKGFAATACDACLQGASNRAQAACPGDPPPWSMMGCYYWKFMDERKACDAGVCAPGGGGGGAISGSADCGGKSCQYLVYTPSCGKDADPDAGNLCHEDCWGKSCSSSTGTCKYMEAKAPNSTISLCHSKCGCNIE